MEQGEIIEAVLEEIRYHAAITDFTVGVFLSQDEESRYFTATGKINQPVEGRRYRLTGSFTVHPRYGEQFAISRAERGKGDARQALKELFRGPNFAGCGEQAALKTADALGDHALQKLLKNPDLIDEVEGLREGQKKAIRKGLETVRKNDQTVIELMDLGLSAAQIDLLNKRYGDHLAEVMQEDCFVPFYEIRGFRYDSAVRAADGLGYAQTDQRRLNAMVFHAIMTSCNNQGDTWIDFDSLRMEVPGLGTDQLVATLNQLVERDLLVNDQGRIVPAGFYNDEIEIAWRLQERLRQAESVEEEALDGAIESIEQELAITYDVKQKEAMKQFFRHPLLILNGGPGTGKSTVVKGILMLCQKFWPTALVQLCAPTGKASKRLKQLSSSKAKTIHSLLGWNAEEDEFTYDETNPLEMDIMIIDEFSMVDTHLFASLLRALPAESRLLLIGDENQLESVGPGRVFNDLIESGTIPQVTLETIFRQKNGSGIVTLAQNIREGSALCYKEGVSFESLDAEGIRNRVEEIVRDSFDPENVQVLAPIYKGTVGIDELNKTMQNLMNPFSPSKTQLVVQDTVFREQDRVMLTRNMPENDVFNGDTGIIVEIDEAKKVVMAQFESDREVTFTPDLLSQLTHAWAMSVHKSQGSEYPEVILVVDERSRRMLYKKLLYTGISRAKKQLYILGDRGLFESGCRASAGRGRNTALKDKLQLLLSSPEKQDNSESSELEEESQSDLSA